MLEAVCALGSAISKAFSPLATMNEELDLNPGLVLSITQEDAHIQPHEHDEELYVLKAGLDAIDNTRNYQEILLFNRIRREDPCISLAEQVHRFKKALSQLPSRSIELTADTEQGDFTDLPRSLIANEYIDEDQSQGVQDTIEEAGWESCREDTGEDQHRQERLKSKAVVKAEAHDEGAQRCDILSVKTAGPSHPSEQTTEMQIAERSASMPVCASKQEQVKQYDKSFKKSSWEGVTRAVKSPTVPLLGAQGPEDGLVHGSVSCSATQVGQLKGSQYLKPQARQTVVQK